MTGADTGLGLETTRALALTKATVVMGVFNVTNGEAVAAEISKSSGNPNIEALAIDLSDTKSIRAFATKVLSKHAVVSTLINDAGIDHTLPSLPALTGDGFERVFQVNYLGPFLLTHLMLPSLRKSPAAKVINVASAASFDACGWGNRVDTCMDAAAAWQTAAVTANGTVTPQPGPCGLGGTVGPGGCNNAGCASSNYGLTKFAQVAHAWELNARELSAGSSVRAFSLHPGFVETPMTANIVPATAAEWCAPLPYKIGTCPITAQAGAATQAYLAAADAGELTPASYYVQCKPTAKAEPAGWVWGGAQARGFFDASSKLLGL